MIIEETRHSVRLELAGEIDCAWREEHADEIQQLLETCPAVVVIDVENVTFMDSTGLSVVALCYRKCQDHVQAGTLYLVNPKPMVIKIVEAVGLARLVEVVDTRESVELMNQHLASLDDKAEVMESGSMEGASDFEEESGHLHRVDVSRKQAVNRSLVS